jgi:Fic family protein
MIYNNFRAMNKIKEFKDKKLTKELILELHKIITNDTLEKTEFEGNFRKTNNINVVENISGKIIYSPPNFDEVESLIEEFCELYNGENQKDFLHPITKAIILHFKIGWIHPFVDGNGRLARTIFFLSLIKDNYWLFEFISISRIIKDSPAQYAKAYLNCEKDENDLTYFIIYNLEKIEIAFSDLKKYIKRKLNQENNKDKYLKIEEIGDMNQAKILSLYELKNKSYYTIKELSEELILSKETIKKNLLFLVEKKYLLKKLNGNKFIFHKSEKFTNLLKND